MTFSQILLVAYIAMAATIILIDFIKVIKELKKEIQMKKKKNENNNNRTMGGK